MMSDLVFDKALTPADRIVLETLADHIQNSQSSQDGKAKRRVSSTGCSASSSDSEQMADLSESNVQKLKALNNPKSPDFELSAFSGFELRDLKLPSYIDQFLLQPYIAWASSVVRVKTDVIMLTHLLIYASTSIPSALILFHRFTYFHGFLHLVMQLYYIGAYTLLMHQHIHMRGVLHKRFALIDAIFPYILDPLMGHTWNTYYFHHVKHHHVEGNGPDDLSSTMRYQRDEIWDLLRYIGRFYVLVWFDLPIYFLRKGRPLMALKTFASEASSYAFYYAASRINGRAALFVYILPLMLLRVGLMVGNWGQHAFVDVEQPDSDYRSSITLIDVASNRYCYNDGYHTSHHLNPMRHWRDHPVSFLQQKETYAKEGALVFHNIDYVMITVRLMMKDYETLAKCLVPIGDQVHLSIPDRIDLLKRLTKRFSDGQIREKYPQCFRVKT
ncbi:hypothetical protein NLU13_7844 [Sarocladium strictum]|uniref:Fatty acid desaturase domain-containing protein n=1 Tax=Sarocladium strictum TaxID=5046 RepID=A0AA39L5X6_SARSR|nr:hypothetical protein NLU13_7844 [Sarocladium strictum]